MLHSRSVDVEKSPLDLDMVAIRSVRQMTKSWKRRLVAVTAAVALAGLAAACAADDEGNDAATATEPENTEGQGGPTEDEISPTSTPETTDANSEPESGDVGIAAFEPLLLPDYAAAVIDDDYASYLIEVEPGIDVHVLEVGSGYPVYLQHGAPTSGLLYRKVVELLPPDQFRIIMPTMVGLGFSSQVPAGQHTLDNHVRWINEALNQLELEELIYVGHDWGGPVGMGALERSPGLLAGAVLLNTVFGAPTGPVELNPQLQALLAPLPADAELTVSVSLFDQLPAAQNDPASLSPDVIDLYRRPIAESDNPIGPLAVFRMAATGPEHPTAEVLRAIDAYTAQLDVPAEIVWGTNDPVLGNRLPSVMAAFPDAPVTETDAGHFLQEEGDSPKEIAAAIQRVHEQVQSQ